MSTLYRHLALIECADEAQLDELLVGGLQRFTVRRLGPKSVQVDHVRMVEIRKLLERLGQTPRVVRSQGLP